MIAEPTRVLGQRIVCRPPSLRVRAAFGVAVVFLMIAKPDAVVSLVVLGLALGVATLVALPIELKQPSGLSSTGA